MISTLFAAIAAAIVATIIGLLRLRSRSGGRKTTDGNVFLDGDLNKPKATIKQPNDHDQPAFDRLQKFIDSNWIRNFEDKQLAYPQYVQVAITDDLHAYWNESQKPENAFANQNVAEAHLVFIKAIKAFINTVLRETTFVRPDSQSSVINSKAERNRKSSNDFDDRYDREVKRITNGAKGLINTYKRYIQVARNESVYR